MAAFRRLVIALAVLGMFAGLASAQITTPMQCTMTTYPNTIRLEGKAEQVGDITISCLTGSVPSDGSVIPTVNFTVQLGGITNAITSRTLATGGVSDALLLIDEPGTTSGKFGGFGSDEPPTICQFPTTGACPTAYKFNNGTFPVMSTSATAAVAGVDNVYQGIVSGTSVTFFGVPVLAPGSAGIARIFRITNLRVDATTQSAASQVTASVTFSGSNVQNLLSLPNNTANVSVIQTGLNATNTKATAGSLPVCNNEGTTVPVGPAAISSIAFAENFGSAFKTRLVGTATAGSSISNSATEQNLPGTYASESGLTLTTGVVTSGTYTTTGLADFGTRLKATFTNVPAGVRLFVSATNVSNALGFNSTISASNSIIATNNTTSYAVAITGSESAVDGASGPAAATPVGAQATSVTYPNGYAGWVEITPASGSTTSTAVWEVENTNPTSNETFVFNIGVIYSANVPPVTGSTANPSPAVLLSYAPTTGTGTIPLFTIVNNTPQTAFNLTSCRTILLFPYVTSNSGFDTGIAISNTSSDPLGTSAQAGACTLNWYPSGTATATSTVAGTAITPTTTPTVIGGTTYLNVASVLVPGFTGYMVAVCNFQYAHGFAFVADWGNGAAQSSAMGYLALVIPDTPTATPVRGAGGGAGEALNN